MMYTVNVLLTCILNCDPPMIRTVCKYNGRFLLKVSYLPSHAFLRRHVALLRESFSREILMFLAAM